MSSIDYGPENSQLWAKKIELDSRIFVLKQQRRWLTAALVVALMILGLPACLGIFTSLLDSHRPSAIDGHLTLYGHFRSLCCGDCHFQRFC